MGVAFFTVASFLFVGFIVSGACHMLGDAMMSPHLIGRSFWFFLLQAIGITLEDFVVACWKHLGFRDGLLVRLVGYTWTAAWFAYSTPYFVDWQIFEAGTALDRPPGSDAVDSLVDYLAASGRLDVRAWLTSMPPA